MREEIKEALYIPHPLEGNDIIRGRKQQAAAGVPAAIATLLLIIAFFTENGTNPFFNPLFLAGFGLWCASAGIMAGGKYNEWKGFNDFDTAMHYFKITGYRGWKKIEG